MELSFQVQLRPTCISLPVVHQSSWQKDQTEEWRYNLKNDRTYHIVLFHIHSFPFTTVSSRGVQEPESSKFFRSRIGLGVKFNVKTGEGVGGGVTISLSYYCNVH